MFRNPVDRGDQKGYVPDLNRDETAGQTLKKIFHQDDTLSRIEEQPAKRTLLMMPMRLAIFSHLCGNPCDHTRSIARKVGGALSAINWNLGQLFRNGYLESKIVEGRKIYWPPGMILEEDLETVKLLRSAMNRKILNFIHASGGNSRERDIVHATGKIQQSTEFHLKKMVSAGIIDKNGNGQMTAYSISQTFTRSIIKYEELSKPFSIHLLALLRADGLMPKGPRLRGSRLHVSIRLPEGRKRITLECNPMACARRYLR